MSANSIRVTDLHIDDNSGLVATANPAPRLSWKSQSAADGTIQTAYEIEVSASASFDTVLAASGVITDERCYLRPWPAPSLKSRDVRYWRVRVRTNNGESDWSAPSRVEASLLDKSDWLAKAISPKSNAARETGGPVPLLRREFALENEIARARLYVTALGVYDVQINGEPVSGDLLEPGWTVYPKRLLFATYDVAPLLKKGANAISAAIGDGWYRGELSWNLTRNNYGNTTALIAQLEVEFADGTRAIVATDKSWRGSYGAIRAAELYHGATLDFREEAIGWREAGFSDSKWEEVVALDLPAHLEPRAMPAVRLIERRALALPKSAGPIQLDVGQNITGYLAIEARGPAGATVTVRHAEILGADGALDTKPLRNARATDTYTLDRQGTRTLRPPFTFHGFRYAEITTSPGVVIESVAAEVIASDLARTGEFSCSHDGLNRLYENALWSQRGNFLAVPTDCPQRDERLGWTGDIQVFAPTACLNNASRGFLASWLKDLALEQREDGLVPVTIPDVISKGGSVPAAAAWGDAATVLPWVLYRAYGDSDVLRAQLPSMRSWVDWCASRTEPDGTWVKDFQFGDWLDPDAPHNKPYKAKTHFGFVATSYLAYSAGLVADAEELLGDKKSADFYRELQLRSARAAWARWSDNAMATQTGCALAIELGIAPKELHRGLGEQLASLVAKNRYRIGTGFVGTPLVLPALTRTGQLETAYRLLLNRECPGWLYQVDKGATTIWERWNAVLPDPAPGEKPLAESEMSTMISFNHYAYGAVAAWLYNAIAGLNVDMTKPPGEQLTIAPLPGGGLTWAKASVETVYGRLTVDWRIERRNLKVNVVVPACAGATFLVPHGWRGDVPSRIGSGVHTFQLALT
jgi:alpha-L-rhamnosidase